jgi:uncharacterized protein (DUF362 family)
MQANGRSQVFVIKTDDRTDGVGELLRLSHIGQLSGKQVAIKANYNSADPFPASTHIDTLSSVAGGLKDKGASVVLAERSGMGITRDVLYDMGVDSLSQKLGFDVVVLDSLKGEDWHKENSPGSHWKRGFLFPGLFREADAIVTTCCLKTHRFGGHFTMSLKNSVGMVAKHDPHDHYNYMYELHGSPYQRLMIAEINAAYQPYLVIMDAIKGFSAGGPEAGTAIEPGVMLASPDRVALDAAGVSILRMYGTTPEVSAGPIFKQEQIARAVELGLGAKGPDDIEVVPVNAEAKDTCSLIEEELRREGPGFKEYRISRV